MIETVWLGVASFAVTNIDDIILLTFFFGQRKTGLAPWQVVVGQFLGFSALVAISLSGLVLNHLLSPKWIGLLGILPIAIGIRRLIRGRHQPHSTPTETSFSNITSVAAVTFASGADNIAVYTPVFAVSSHAQVVILLAVFAVMLMVWCGLAAALAVAPGVRSALIRFGHILMPVVLVALGVYIFIKSHSYELFSNYTEYQN